jgi:hypothetical protein
LWKKAGTLLQQINRVKGVKGGSFCVVCYAISTVIHHHFHWSRSVELRLHEQNLIPLCNKCHLNIHLGDMRTKIKYEQKMRSQYGQAWEDELLLQDQTHKKRTSKETRQYLQEWMAFAKQDLEEQIC